LLDGNRVRIQGREYKYSKSRDIPANVRTVTVKRDNLANLWLCFVVAENISQSNQTMTGNSAGFDFGLETFLTASDGQKIASPLYYRQAMAELKQAQQNLARKVKGSDGWRQAKRVVARIYQRVVNRRRDWFFKLAHELTDRYDCLYFEDLAMKGMQRLWGRQVGDLARSEFMGILKHVAKIKGKVVGLVDRFYPSSKTCSDCGEINHRLTLADRRWVCAGCGSVHDRDDNAAKNIHRVGASTLGLGDVRPPLAAVPV
jgi:putative transposase